MLSRLLAISALTGLGFNTIGNEYRQACKTVEAAISNASKVYYPGEHDCEQLLWWRSWSSCLGRQPPIHQRRVPFCRI